MSGTYDPNDPYSQQKSLGPSYLQNMQDTQARFVATAPQDNATWWGRWFATPLANAGFAAQNAVAAGYMWAQKGISRTIATPLIAANPASKDFGKWSDAWDDSQVVSPGQALTAIPGGISPAFSVLQAVSGKTIFGTTPGALGGVDPTSQSMQDRYANDPLSKIVTGGTDAAIDWYSDPLILGGRLVKAATLPIRTNPVQSLTDIAKISTKMAPGQTYGDAIDKIRAGSWTAGSLNTVIRNADKPELIQSVIKNAPTREEAVTATLAAAGDPVSLQALANIRPYVWEQLRRASLTQSLLDEQLTSIGKVDAAGNITHAWTETADQVARNQRVIEDLTAHDTWLAAATGNGQADSILGTLANQFFSPVKVVNDYRDWRAGMKAQGVFGVWAERTFKAGPYAPVVKVLDYMGSEVPAGIVRVKGKDFAGSGREILATVRAAGGSREQAEHWYSTFASGLTPGDRAKAVVDMEEDLVTTMAARHGLGPDVARKIYGAHSQARQSAMDDYLSKGYFLDDNKHLVKVPWLDSQLADTVPVVDFNRLDEALTEHADDIAATFSAASAKETGEMWLSMFSQVWKPAVLLRVGYTVRNVGEAYIAGAVATSRLYGNPGVGAGHWLYNRMQNAGRASSDPGALLRDPAALMDTATSREVLLAHAAELEAQRTEWSGRLAELQGTAAKAAAPTQLSLLDPVVDAEQLARDIARHHAELDQIGMDLDQTRQALDDMAALKPKPNKHLGEKDTDMYGYNIPGAFGGPAGAMARQTASAGVTVKMQQRTVDSAGMEAKLIGRLQRTGAYRTVTTQDVDYFDNAAHLANTIVHNSELAKAVITQDPSDVITWLRTKPHGRGVARELNLAPDEVAPHVLKLRAALFRYFPDDTLRQRIVAGEVSATDVANRLAGRTDLSPMHGEELESLTKHTLGEKYDKVVTRAFQVLGTMPEDHLARWPFYNAVYMSTMRSLVLKNWDHLQTLSHDQAQALISGEFQSAARARATKSLKTTMYTVERRTSPAQALRYISPFFQVTQNRALYYGRQLIDNPVNMARLFLGWNAIQTVKDSFGNDMVHVHLPGPVANFLGLQDTPDLAFNKQSLNLLFQGEPWYSPGWGPVVVAPAAKILRDNPDSIPPWIKSMVGPHGLGLFPTNDYGSNDWNQLIPTTLRRAIPWTQDEGSQDWLNSYAQIATTEAWRFSTGQRADKPTDAEIKDRTDALWLFRLGAAGLLPAQPTLKGPLAGMQDIYRQDQQTYGKDADTKFLADHPDYYDFMISLTRNPTGIGATDANVGMSKKYADLIGKFNNPGWGGIIINDPNNTSFDSDAYNWQNGRLITPSSDLKYRGQQSVSAALDQRLIDRGWHDYHALTAWRDAQVAQSGIADNSPQAKMLAQYVAYRREQIGQSNPTWWKQYMQQDNAFYAKNAQDLASILTEPNFVKDNAQRLPWLASARDYLVLRSWMTDQLAARKRNGLSGSITAQSNADLADYFAYRRKQLAASDPAWATYQERMFNHDDLTEVPGP